MLVSMSDVSRILNALSDGELHAADALLPLVYNELRVLATKKMACENPGQTLQATSLVHEAYMRLVGSEDQARWENRKQFFCAAAEAMRRILVENARRKKRVRHGGGQQRNQLHEDALAINQPLEELLEIHEALDKFAEIEPACAELVKLHYFAGLTLEECAEAQGIPLRTVCRNWTFSRLWLFRFLGGGK
jgi:RNA polymerase sigma factor (TIGR02999 family)